MKKLDSPLRLVATLLLVALALGVVAFGFSFHGTLRWVLRAGFFLIGGLAIIALPLATRKR